MKRFCLCALALATCLPVNLLAGDNYTTIRVASGLTRPIWVTAPEGDFHRVFIIEQPGRIRIFKDGELLATPFLDIDSIVLGGTSLFDERGLLGLAFAPDYATSGIFYVYYVNLAQNTVLARYHVSIDPDLADSASAEILLTITQPTGFPNHKGGWIAFGPDGYLWAGTGDGGSGNDPGNRAQDITNQLLGKLLRLDVSGDDFPDDPTRNYKIPPTNPFVGVEGDDEIVAYGLRNPWRNAFDPATGELYIADVGQDVQEEINIQPAGALGRNYGWRCMEGNLCTGLSGCTCNDPSLTLPVHTYDHSDVPLRCSVTGGEVYRGCAVPELEGQYFFAEYCSDEIWTLRRNGDQVIITDLTTQLAPVGGALNVRGVSSFGHDAYGEMYICDRDDGEVFKIVPITVSPDCNGNGHEDACDLLDGSSADEDGSGIPDECEVPPAIVSSEPPNGSIDARQPIPINGGNPLGWQSVDITFDSLIFRLTVNDFAITQQGGLLNPPTILGLVPITDFTVRIILNRAIEPKAWTEIQYGDGATSLRVGSLPGDVNADRVSSPVDILALIDALNGVGDPRPIWSTDIDRSGVMNPADILREIDLLNGADAFEVYNGATLP